VAGKKKSKKIYLVKLDGAGHLLRNKKQKTKNKKH